jgi:hypothetical protein
VTSTLAALLAAQIYVSPAGNDSWSGSLAEPNATKSDGPLATLTRARDAARGKPGAVIQLRAGVYRISEPLVLGPEDSGTTWSASPNEKSVVSGGRVISGWKKEGELWTAPASPPFRQLFVDGARRPRARTPNEGFYRIVTAGPDDRTSFTYKPGELRRYERLAEAEVVFLHDWSISRVAVAEIDEASRTVRVKDPIGSGSPHFRMTNFEKNPRYLVENALELLDAPGEWYLDAAAAKLYYRPLPGEEVSAVEAVAAVAEQLLVIRGEPLKPVKGVTFKGISFEHTEWAIPKLGYAEGQASFYEPRVEAGKPKGRTNVPPAVQAEFAVGCVFDGCRFSRLGGSGLHLMKGCHDNRVERCEFFDISANGAMIGEGYAAARAGADAELIAKRNALTASRVHRCGAQFFGAVGVWVGITDGTVVSRNDIHDLPYTGVSLGWIWNPTPSPCKDNRIESNHIYRVMQLLSDGGGIYTLGRMPGTVLRGNLIYDVPVNLGRAESNGIFMDEGTTDLLVEGNVIYNVSRAAIRFHRAGTNTLRRNTLVVPSGIEPFRYNASKKEDKIFEENLTPDPATFKPPTPKELNAGRP